MPAMALVIKRSSGQVNWKQLSPCWY